MARFVSVITASYSGFRRVINRFCRAARSGIGRACVTDENGNKANVTIPDVIQSNGVIHVIDAVLLPKM